MKKILLHGLAAGVLSAIACLFYNALYNAAMFTDFSDFINIFTVMGTCLCGCLIAALGYYFLTTRIKDGTTVDVIFNVVFVLLTFISCVYPFSKKLPLEIEYPELFPGLVIPMHFFPVLFWIALNPILKKMTSED